MKKLISLLLAALMILPLVPAVFAENAGNTVILKINPYGGSEDDIDTLTWFDDPSGTHFLFLPADTDLAAAKVYFNASSDVTLDGQAIACGGSAVSFTAGSHTLACGVDSYPLTVCASENIPAVYIATESGSLEYIHQDKNNKEPAVIRVYENGKMTMDKELKQIKGRGNSTWKKYDKKPYNIKFDKKTDMFGMGKAKKWTLLANACDTTLLNNIYGWEFAKEFGLPYTSEFKPVDLYLNGDYAGNYVICESVEVDENRVDINDLEKATEKANPDVDLKTLEQGGSGINNTVLNYHRLNSRKWIEIPNDPADISGGYLLEYEYGERYNDELCGFVTYNGQPIVLKAPEYASKAQVNYIADFMNEATQALYSETGYNSEGKHYSEYFDMESLINMYILQELSMNYDAALSSFFAYKPAGEDKIYFGPVWDMDIAFGCRSYHLNIQLSSTDLWYANQLGRHNIPTVLTAANRHPEFRDAADSRWAEIRADGVFERVSGFVADYTDSIAASAVMNSLRWNTIFSRDPAKVKKRWCDLAGVGVDYVAGRKQELDKGFGENGAYLYYDINGAQSSEWALVSEIKEIGETFTVRDYSGNGVIFPPQDALFCGWNTKADGSGTNYLPGDTAKLTSEETVLYAIWKTQEEIDAAEAAKKLAEYKAEFEAAKKNAVAEAAGKINPDDSGAVKNLVANAQAKIGAFDYDESKTLEENLEYVSNALAALDTAIAAQREKDNSQPEEPDEEQDVCAWCGKHHTGTFGRVAAIFHSVLYFIYRLFGILKK